MAAVTIIDGGDGGAAGAAAEQSTDPADDMPIEIVTMAPPPTSAVQELAPGLSCPQATQNAELPTAAPAKTVWTVYRGNILPTSPVHGPTRASGDVARCFAHTPTGALIAAAQISARYFSAPDWQSVMQQSVLPGPERDDAAVMRQAMDQSRTAPPPDDTDDTDRLQILGFKFAGYSAETASVQLLRGGFDGKDLVSALYTLQWTGGDWRLKIQRDGAAETMVQPEGTRTGFVDWTPGGSS
ncbi:hypothetical protein [Yinghuangia sp. YIM S09857]|uniref:hypothetical protein n=1 Tax=Yinghuangia sp. YIM S09857 TaxID=3436929 RepID=UPI003F52D0EC